MVPRAECENKGLQGTKARYSQVTYVREYLHIYETLRKEKEEGRWKGKSRNIYGQGVGHVG